MAVFSHIEKWAKISHPVLAFGHPVAFAKLHAGDSIESSGQLICSSGKGFTLSYPKSIKLTYQIQS